jgi:hypothetical protein
MRTVMDVPIKVKQELSGALDRPDRFYVEAPVGFELLAGIMTPTGLRVTGFGWPNGVRAVHDIVVLELNKPFQPDIGRTLDFIDVVASSQGLIHIFKYGPWPEAAK